MMMLSFACAETRAGPKDSERMERLEDGRRAAGCRSVDPVVVCLAPSVPTIELSYELGLAPIDKLLLKGTE